MTLKPADERERAQKVMARIGIGSRRQCEELITNGEVLINGALATIGDKIGPSDTLEVSGVRYSTHTELVVYVLNKPTGYISTASDERQRATVMDLIPANPRVFNIGRLDRETEGLLLFTNDGDLAFRLTHPSFGIEKEYLVHVEGKVARSTVRKLANGVELEDGVTAPARVALVEENLIKLTIHEGRNRQVRRMCDHVGHRVKRLVRVRVGPISDRALKPGEWRRLSSDELLDLQRAVKLGDGNSADYSK